MKDLRVPKIVKEIKFEGVWGILKSGKGFQILSFTKCFRLTPGFMPNSALQEKYGFCFSRCF